MSSRGTLIIEGEQGWHIHVGDKSHTLPKASQNDEIVAAVQDLRARASGVGSDCIIAPASTSCFFSQLHVPPEVDTRDRPTLTYELENHLPIDAESMAADFSVLPAAGNQNQAVAGHAIAAIAVEASAWKPLVETLESRGIQVTNIIPSATLAITSLHAKHGLAGTNRIMLCHGKHVDLIILADDRICSWKYTKLEEPSLARHKVLEVSESARTLVVNGTDTQATMIRDNLGQIEIEPESLTTHQIEGANINSSKPGSIHFNLRRGALASEDPLRPINRQLMWTACSLAIFLLAIILGSWWRTVRIERKITENLRAQSSAFQESFPDTRIPASLLRRVRSEHTRIMGSRNANKQIEVPNSATEVMRLLLLTLPTEIRLKVSSIDIRDGELDLTFQVQHFVEAGTVAEALSQGGFDVSQPATTQKDVRTFESTIQATWRKKDSESKEETKADPPAASAEKDAERSIESPARSASIENTLSKRSQPDSREVGAR